MTPLGTILGPKRAFWAQESQNPIRRLGFIFKNLQILKVQLWFDVFGHFSGKNCVQRQNLPLGPHFAPKGAFWAQKPGKTVRHRTFGAVGFCKPYRGTKGHGNFNLFYFCQFWAILRDNQQKLVIFVIFGVKWCGPILETLRNLRYVSFEGVRQL